MVRFFSILGLVALMSLTANAQWSGSNGWSGSSNAQSNIPAPQTQVSSAVFEIDATKTEPKALVQFPENSIIRRDGGSKLIWAYDGKQFVTRQKDQTFADMIALYAGSEIPVGQTSEWKYTYVDTGRAIIYQAEHLTMKVYAQGIVERGIIRNTDAYVKSTLVSIHVGQQGTSTAVASVPATTPAK